MTAKAWWPKREAAGYTAAYSGSRENGKCALQYRVEDQAGKDNVVKDKRLA